jgi:hypothetical protein
MPPPTPPSLCRRHARDNLPDETAFPILSANMSKNLSAIRDRSWSVNADDDNGVVDDEGDDSEESCRSRDDVGYARGVVR